MSHHIVADFFFSLFHTVIIDIFAPFFFMDFSHLGLLRYTLLVSYVLSHEIKYAILVAVFKNILKLNKKQTENHAL